MNVRDSLRYFLKHKGRALTMAELFEKYAHGSGPIVVDADEWCRIYDYLDHHTYLRQGQLGVCHGDATTGLPPVMMLFGRPVERASVWSPVSPLRSAGPGTK